MKSLFLDLVHDLREKRLLPVAILLAAGILIVPVALRSNGEPASSSTPTAAAPAAGGAAANAGPVVTADASVKASRLGAYSSKNPFKAPKAAAPAPQDAPAGGTTAGGTAGGTTPSGGGSSSPSPAPTNDLSTPSLGGGAPAAPPAPVQPVKPKTEIFTYTVDVRVGKRGEAKTHHDVERLDVLPDDRRPLIVFLGVNNARTTAIFLVDSSVQADGEGRCKPDPKTCSFLYLKTDSDHNEEEFIQADPATGTAATEWTLKLLKINRVSLSELEKKKPSAAQAKRAIKRAKALRKREAVPFHFLFEIPAFADELVAPVATTGQ